MRFGGGRARVRRTKKCTIRTRVTNATVFFPFCNVLCSGHALRKESDINVIGISGVILVVGAAPQKNSLEKITLPKRATKMQSCYRARNLLRIYSLCNVMLPSGPRPPTQARCLLVEGTPERTGPPGIADICTDKLDVLFRFFWRKSTARIRPTTLFFFFSFPLLFLTAPSIFSEMTRNMPRLLTFDLSDSPYLGKADYQRR